ncbi:hypothetical protein [Rahnella sp. R3(2024)]|jgi:hypothetical protein|uniref:hypothetical protein n=1 Tax=Rahnella TaxID=34037 RepID=UPI0006FCEFA7|nr:hypothetical protein ASE99_01785 [Serratia sp. Leaf51]MBU9830773.1 hypothetical protein [Rahnella rivi]THD54636.1 hypothetical protein ERD95_03995 [Enterobacteriaceae bacterium ML5]
MSFKEIKGKVIACLKNGQVRFAVRREIHLKNLLSTGEVTSQELERVIGLATGQHYQSRRHHLDSSLDVHIITLWYAGVNWYIKWYFAEPNSVFISVHH